MGKMLDTGFSNDHIWNRQSSFVKLKQRGEISEEKGRWTHEKNAYTAGAWRE